MRSYSFCLFLWLISHNIIHNSVFDGNSLLYRKKNMRVGTDIGRRRGGDASYMSLEQVANWNFMYGKQELRNCNFPSAKTGGPEHQYLCEMGASGARQQGQVLANQGQGKKQRCPSLGVWGPGFVEIDNIFGKTWHVWCTWWLASLWRLWGANLTMFVRCYYSFLTTCIKLELCQRFFFN